MILPQTIAICNGKGGAGKTPTAIHLAFASARQGHTVLLIDLDPQGSASYHHLGLAYKKQQPTVYNALLNLSYITPITLRVSQDPTSPFYHHSFSLLPAHDELGNGEIEFTNNPSFLYQKQLDKLIRKQYANFEVIIIDTPGSHISIYPTMALTAAQKVIVPVKAELMSLEGTVDTMALLRGIREDLNPTLMFWGILPTQYEANIKHNQDVLKLIHEIPDPTSPQQDQTCPVYIHPSRKRSLYNDATGNRCDVRDLERKPELGLYWDQLAEAVLIHNTAPIAQPAITE
jgi:chromosome partitioning protein